jgi:transposase InsO family protein
MWCGMTLRDYFAAKAMQDYNRERRHSTIGYLSPIDYEQVSINTRTLTPVEP